jgi:hypothetical protein
LPFAVNAMVPVAFVLGCLAFLPAVAVSCDCMLNWTVARSFALVNTVFTGRVERRLPNVAWEAVYIVKVDNVLMGCSVVAPNQVVVRTGKDGAMCGVALSVNETYLFSGWNTSISDGIRQQIGTDTTNCQAVRIGMCYVNVPWSRVTTETLQILNQLNTSQCCQNCTTASNDCRIQVPNQTPTAAPISVRAPAEVPTPSRPAQPPISVDAPMFGRVVPTLAPVAAPKAAPMRVPSQAPFRTGLTKTRLHCRILGRLLRSCRNSP